MNIHEFQAKKILQQYGIAVPPFVVITSIDDLDSALKTLGSDKVVLKVQVHAGGRGKAGGVKIAKSYEDAKREAKNLIGMKIVNNQTGPQGVIAHSLLVTPMLDYKKEYYLAAVIDRKKASAMLIASPEGGMDIEEIADKSPEKILTIPITNEGKIRSYNLIKLAKFMGWKGKTADSGKKLAAAVAKAFVSTDSSLLEINPLVETLEGDLIALDAKFSIDENGLFRQKEIESFFDSTQIPKAEAQAQEFDLAYISLDGDIGCMVNGAGLAMATMDIINYHGGKAANFLDVGGGASQEKVAEGFRIILQDDNVKAIFINIFGGIMNCATLAGGIIEAAATQSINVPLIVRMEGTNVEEGKKMLEASNLKIVIANTLADGAEQAVLAANSYTTTH